VPLQSLTQEPRQRPFFFRRSKSNGLNTPTRLYVSKQIMGLMGASVPAEAPEAPAVEARQPPSPEAPTEETEATAEASVEQPEAPVEDEVTQEAPAESAEASIWPSWRPLARAARPSRRAGAPDTRELRNQVAVLSARMTCLHRDGRSRAPRSRRGERAREREAPFEIRAKHCPATPLGCAPSEFAFGFGGEGKGAPAF
jgi:hypothetical protein